MIPWYPVSFLEYPLCFCAPLEPFSYSFLASALIIKMLRLPWVIVTLYTQSLVEIRAPALSNEQVQAAPWGMEARTRPPSQKTACDASGEWKPSQIRFFYFYTSVNSSCSFLPPLDVPNS